MPQPDLLNLNALGRTPGPGRRPKRPSGSGAPPSPPRPQPPQPGTSRRRRPRDPTRQPEPKPAASPAPKPHGTSVRARPRVVAGGEGKPAPASQSGGVVGWEAPSRARRSRGRAVWASGSASPHGPTSHDATQVSGAGRFFSVSGRLQRTGGGCCRLVSSQLRKVRRRGPRKVTRSGVRAGRRLAGRTRARTGAWLPLRRNSAGRITTRPETSPTFPRARAVGSSCLHFCVPHRVCSVGGARHPCGFLEASFQFWVRGEFSFGY